MRYEDFIRKVSELEYIPDRQTADAATKAVLGILASRMDEPGARRLTEHLPAPLNYDKLVGHQARPTPTSGDEYFTIIREQFNLTHDQAIELVNTVLRLAKSTLDRETLDDMEKRMPSDWVSVIERA